MSTPKAVTDTITALRAERQPLASRLDAIDLAIDNLCRVYGLHGTPQALPIERRAKPAKKKPVVIAEADGDKTDAAARRELLLTTIERAMHGLTAAELRNATPKMDPKDRGNALNILRLAGKVRRAGNTWVRVAA